VHLLQQIFLVAVKSLFFFKFDRQLLLQYFLELLLELFLHLLLHLFLHLFLYVLQSGSLAQFELLIVSLAFGKKSLCLFNFLLLCCQLTR